MIYWFILFSITLYQLIKKEKSIFYLKTGLYIFILGVFLKIITLTDFSEFFMRISFIFLLVGLVLSYSWRGRYNQTKIEDRSDKS